MFQKIALIASLFAVQAFAHSQYEFGLSAGNVHPFKGSTSFYNAADEGHSISYWLGYALDEGKSVQLEYDHFDFDGVNTEHDALLLAGVQRFYSFNKLHPIAKIGLGAVESKNLADEKKSSFLAKAAVGLELDCKYVNLGVLANYHYINKAGDTDTFKNAQALTPALFITFHPGYSHESSTSKISNTPTQTIVKDTDSDGVADSDDKCPNTAKDTVVNAWGCAETEKAAVKLNVEFPAGKAVVSEKAKADIKELADFMKKYPETTVEIAGHTDNTGSEKTNLKLSKARAEAVVNALIADGIEKNRLTANGYGSSKPVADNSTAEGRTANRRVMAEISVNTNKKK